MPELFPVKQCLLMCFYSIENTKVGRDLFKKQCGSHLYFWVFEEDKNCWRFVVSDTNIKHPNIWTAATLPNDPIEPETVYNMEVEHSPKSHNWIHRRTEESESRCVFNNKGRWEYEIYGENA